ncbi:hypothetical protein SMUG_01990 [Gallibacterium anatis]
MPLTVNAAVDRAAVLKKVVESGNTDGLTDEEKTWFTSFFGGTTLQPSNQGNKIGALVLSYGGRGEPQIGTDNKNVKGKVNGYLENSGIIYGLNNEYAGQSYVLGDDNIAMVNDNNEGIAIGYQNNMIANGGIGIGMFNKVLPTDHENEGYTSNGIVIGKQSLGHSSSIVVGQKAVSSADSSIAIGQQAIASGSLEAANAFIKSASTPGSFHYAEYLQKTYPNVFGKYDASQTEYQRMDTVDPILFEKYKWWFQKSGIDSYEKLIEQFGGGNSGEHGANAVMSNFGWKYALTQNNVAGTTAIGFMAKAVNSYATALGPDATASGQYSLATGLSSRATGDNTAAYGRGANASKANAVAVGYLAKASAENSSALGAFSVASSDYGVALGMESESLPEDVVEVEKAPYSGVKLSVNGNGKTGADNDILRGPVSFGSKLYNKQGTQTATYIRQVQYVADGTHDTDAVNLRQLRGALFNGIKAGDGVTITKQDDPTKPDYGTITVTATNTNTGNATAYSFEAGDNVTVTSEEKDGVTHITISAKDTTYTPGENVTIDNGNISATDTKYTAGDNITIDKDGKISAKDTTYTAGENITIDDNNKISAAKYEAGDNVSIKKKEGADNTFVISATNSGGTDFNVKGDVGEATQVKSGDTVNITGGATGLSHNANIGVEKADDGLKLRLAKDITTESVTLSKGENGKSTKMDAESVTVNNGKQSTKVSAESVSVNNGSQHTTVNAGGISVNNNNQAPVSLTSRGLDNGGNRISNVADGVQPHDAVNVSQLNRVKKKMEKHSDAGTAAAIAVGNLPHAMHSGKSMVAVAGGSYGGESAVAIGVSHTNEKGNVILKLSGTSDSNGKYGVGAGVGYEF